MKRITPLLFVLLTGIVIAQDDEPSTGYKYKCNKDGTAKGKGFKYYEDKTENENITTTIYYNKKGEIVLKNTFDYNDKGYKTASYAYNEKGELRSKHTYEHDAQGMIIAGARYMDTAKIHICGYENDANGNKKRIFIEQSESIKGINDKRPVQAVSEYDYNEDGKLVKITEYESKLTNKAVGKPFGGQNIEYEKVNLLNERIYKLDEKGRDIEITNKSKGIQVSRTVFKYDDKDRIIEEVEYNTKDKPTYVIKYKYK